MLAEMHKNLKGVADVPIPHCEGAGIVTQTSPTYWPSTYVQGMMIRETGCKLPVYIYHKEHEPIDPRILAIPGVVSRVIEYPEVTGSFADADRSAIQLDCGLEKFLWLGADVYPCKDPTELLDDPDESGVVAWRDHTTGDKWVWEVWGLPKDTLITTWTPQSDTFIFNLPRAYRWLCMVHWFNLRAKFYTPFSIGDQTPYRATWAHLGIKPRTYTPYRVDASRFFLFLHNGPDDKPLFVHRTGCKFAAEGVFKHSAQYFADAPGEQLAWGHYTDWVARR